MADKTLARETLARVDERTRSIQNEVIHLRDDFKLALKTLADTIKDNEAKNSSLYRDMEENYKDLDNKVESMQKEFYSELEKNYVRRDVFEPIKKVVYGLISVVLIGVVTALLSLVVLRAPAVPSAHGITLETPSH